MHFLFSKISSFFSPFFSTGGWPLSLWLQKLIKYEKIRSFLLKIINIFPKTVFLFALLLFVRIFLFIVCNFYCQIYNFYSLGILSYGFRKPLHSRLKGIFLCFSNSTFLALNIWVIWGNLILMSGILPSCIVYNMQPEIIPTLKWIKTLLFLCCIYWLLFLLFPF